jgi:hypothetical protein
MHGFVLIVGDVDRPHSCRTLNTLGLQERLADLIGVREDDLGWR